nr:MAG TPA: hypothetical protein [Caudoviricetes sp.]
MLKVIVSSYIKSLLIKLFFRYSVNLAVYLFIDTF